MKIKNKENFIKTFDKFLKLDTPILIHGPFIPYDLFDFLLKKDSYIYIDTREIESVTLIDLDKIFKDKIVVFANINYNKSFVSFLKGLKRSFIATSNVFLNFGIPLLVEYEIEKKEFSLAEKIIDFNLKENYNINFYNKHKMLEKRLENLEILNLENRILIYNTFKGLFGLDISKEVYLTEEMIYNFKKEKVNHLLHYNYFFSTENLQILFDILENIKFKENLILFGDTGTGKTSLIEFLAKQLKKELFIVNISNDTEISDFVGKFVLQEKELIFKEGYFLKALKKDCWLLLDEVNLAPQEVLDFLESCVTKRSVFVNNEVCEFHPNFLIFSCMNLNDVGKKNFDSSIFIKKELKNSPEDFVGLNEKYNPNDNRNLSLPTTNKREYVRALKLLRNKYELDFVFKLLYNQNILQKKRIKNEILLTDYVITEENESVVERVEMAIEVGLPVLLQGDTSTGKTSLITALAKKYKKKLYRINNHEQTEASDYFGDGTDFNEGIMNQAIKNGDWILLDELNLAPSDVLEVLNRILETSYKEFRLFSTQNLNYSGRKPLSKAFLSRFIVVDFSVKSSDELKKILSFKYPNQFNHKIVKIYDELKLQRNFNELITLRDCFRWSKRIINEKDFIIKGLMVIYERQRGKDRKIIQKYFSEHFENYKKYFIEKQEELKLQNNTFVLNFSFTKLICLILDAWKYKEPVLLVGETGIGKSKAIEMACTILNRPFITVSLSGNTDPSDFIGSFSISKDELIWTDGPLTKAMKEGKILILDEINLAENSVLERLNSVLEDERTLFITEKNEIIKAHNDFLVISSMNPSTDIGKRELSPALRNRFTEIFFELTDDEKNEIGCKMLNNFYNFSNISLRKVELMRDYFENIHLKYFKNSKKFDLVDVEKIEKKDYKIINDEFFGIEPFLYKIKEKTEFDFTSLSVKSNLFSLLRALELKRPILLEGDCGTGKTSLIVELAKILGKKIYKINLCESTEMCDLIGQFTPTQNGIVFKEGIISVLKKGDWLLLDEINLCSQSVLEGLNSLLDYRRSFYSTYLSFVMHEESRIFGTMNESNLKNKRNLLPRSFIDRFIKLKFSLTENDIKKIIENKNMIYYKDKGLRYNLLANKIKKNYSEKNEISYSLKSDKIIFNNESENELVIESSVIKNGYTLIHSQLNDLDTFLRCKKTNTPVLLMGKARDNFIKIIYDFCEIHCHEEMDFSDLIGQFVKENNNFVWKDSPLIQSIKNKKTIYINSANLVEKTVLDRINSLLEGKIELFEHDNEILKNESFIILGSDEELSPAIMDRCVIIKPSLILNHIDISKIFSQKCFYQEILPENNIQCYLQEIKKIINFSNLLDNTKFFANSLEESYDLIYLDKLKYEHLNEIPFYLKNTLPFLTDDQLFKLFSFTKLEEEIFNDELLEFYSRNCYFFKDTFEDNLSNLQALITENSDEFKLVNFIKRISNCDFIKLEEFPYGIKELKKVIIKLDIKELKNVLLDINYEINFKFNKKFNELIKLGIDPLVLKKKKLINKIKKYFNNNLEKLTNHFVNLYKYGKSNFDITFFTKKINQIQEEINEIKERNYSEFIKNIYDYNLFYQNSEFDDILNYYKVSLVKKIPLSINECNPCVYFNNHFNCKNYNYFISPFSLFYQIKNNKKEINNLIRQLNFNDLINELSKYFINLLINKPIDDKSLIIELIKNNKLIRSKIKLEEKELSNDLLNELLIYKYNKENKEMKYFLLLFFYKMSYEECQKYFLDCFVFQFKERVYFTKEYFNILMNNEFIKNISDSFTNPVLLYNTALLYSVLINKEKGNVHMLSLINNLPIKKYENIKGCLCSHSKLKKYYKKIKSEKFIFKDICFCKKEYKKIKLNLNEIYFEREPLKIFSKEEKLIGYLMWKVKESNEKERNMVLGVVLEPSLDILEKVVMYFYRKEKIIEEKVSGDEMNEDVKENQDDRLLDEENEKSNEESNKNLSENEESDNSILEKEKENDNLSNFEEENDIFSNFENEIISENESEEVSEEINDNFNEEEINLSSEEKNEEEKNEEEKSEEEKNEEEKNEEEKSEECNDSFSNCDFEKNLSKEVEKEEYSSISDNFEMNNIESMTEKKNDELLEDNLLNENLTDDLLINDLQNKEINLEINNEQTCKEAQNYLTKVEEEKIKEINKEDFFIVLKNNLPDNKKNKFKGDFKSGKKINMKRIVGYFMSDFQKDKIFLRRIKESKKEYIINIYIDNSKSMLKYNLKKKLIYLFDLLKYSFDKLNLQFNLFSFGEETKEINELNLLFNEERSNIIFKEGYNIVLTDGIINQMMNYNTLYLFLNNELRNMKQVICDNGIRVVNYLEMMNVKYCLVDDDNFIEEFGKGLAELIKE